jgi:hypothetical protein
VIGVVGALKDGSVRETEKESYRVRGLKTLRESLDSDKVRIVSIGLLCYEVSDDIVQHTDHVFVLLEGDLEPSCFSGSFFSFL